MDPADVQWLSDLILISGYWQVQPVVLIKAWGVGWLSLLYEDQSPRRVKTGAALDFETRATNEFHCKWGELSDVKLIYKFQQICRSL